MPFSVEIDYLVVSIGNPISAIAAVSADKTTLGPPKLKRNWDVKPGFGLQGAFCVYTGEGLAAFDATFEFWDESKESLWDQFANVFLTAPVGVKPPALGVYHPVLIKPPFRIQNVQVTEIEGWSLIAPGRWQTRLSFLQYRAPAPFVPKKTEPVVPAVEKQPPARPMTEQDIRLQEAAARLRAVASGGT
jgi:hypothetical protein